MRNLYWGWVWGWVALLGLGLGCHKGGQENAAWMSVQVARAVDQQFGKAITHDPMSPENGDGSHEGDNLLGSVDLKTVIQAVQYLTEQLLVPSDPVGNLGKLRESPLMSKLTKMASASINNNPCRHDADRNGVPDYKESLNQNPEGMCTVPRAVECQVNDDRSFTVKFTQCVPVSKLFSTLWTPQLSPTFCTALGVGVNNFYSPSWQVSCIGGRVFGRPIRRTHTNYTPHSSNYTITYTTTTFRKFLTNTTTNNTITAPTMASTLGNVGCEGGTILNYQTKRNYQTKHPPLPSRITGTAEQWRAVNIIYYGAITLQYGTEEVGEQVFHLRYNRFTRIWGDEPTSTTEDHRFLTLDGEAMEYRVIGSDGYPALGTTPVPTGFEKYTYPLDGLQVEKFDVTFDPDGTRGPLPAGEYQVARGTDNEDGQFFLNSSDQLVSLKDKNGPDLGDRLLHLPNKDVVVDGVRLLAGDTTGFTFALNFYDLNNPLGNGYPDDNQGATCGRPYPNNTRCRVEVKVNPFERTFDLLSADPAICPDLWDWTPTNPKYLKVPF